MTKKTNELTEINELTEMLVFNEFMCEVLNKISKHFIKNDFLSKEDFFNIQKKVLKSKAKYMILNYEFYITSKKSSEKVKNERKRS